MPPGRFHRTLMGLCAALLVVTVGGCAAKIKGWSQESYRSPSFVMADMTRSGMAVLPVMILDLPAKSADTPSSLNAEAPYASKTVPASEPKKKPDRPYDGFRITFSEILLSNLKARYPEMTLVSPNETLQHFNDAGIADLYGRFDKHYVKTGVTSDTLRRFSSALDCRFLLFSQAVVSESTSDASVIVVWTFGRKSMMRAVKFSGQIWDAQTGRQVWEGTGVGYHQLVSYEGFPLTEQLSQTAVTMLLDTIDANRSAR